MISKSSWKSIRKSYALHSFLPPNHQHLYFYSKFPANVDSLNPPLIYYSFSLSTSNYHLCFSNYYLDSSAIVIHLSHVFHFLNKSNLSIVLINKNICIGW